MRQYKAFYNGKSADISAESLYAAKLAAIAHFRVPKSRQHMVSIVLADVPVDPASL